MAVFDTIKKLVTNAIPGVGFVNSLKDLSTNLRSPEPQPAQPIQTPAPLQSMAPTPQYQSKMPSATPLTDNLVGGINTSVEAQKNPDPIGSGVKRILSTQLPQPLAQASQKLNDFNTMAEKTPLGLPKAMSELFVNSANASRDAMSTVNEKSRIAREGGAAYPLVNRLADNANAALTTAGALYQMNPAGAGQKLIEGGAIGAAEAARGVDSDPLAAIADPYSGLGTTGFGMEGAPAIATDIAGSLLLDPQMIAAAGRKFLPGAAAKSFAPQAAQVAEDVAQDVVPEAQRFVPDIQRTGKDLTGTTLQDVERAIGLEGSTDVSALQEGTKGRGFIADALRSGEEKLSLALGGLRNSKNPVAQEIGKLANGFYSNIGLTQADTKTLAKAQSSYGNILADATSSKIYEILGNDATSVARVHAVLDPSLNKGTKLTEAMLNPNEKDALSVYRLVADYINDSNYKNGFIDKKLWQQGKGGNYIKRMYEIPSKDVWYKIPTKKKPLDLTSFIERKELNPSLKSIKDPAYLLSKKLYETVHNNEMLEVTSELAQNKRLVSSRPKPGFVRLQKDPSFGALSGKYIDQRVSDQIQGYTFQNKLIEKMYDALNVYDKNPLRQGQKKLLTVFNPTTALGNKTSNYIFAGMSGINPIEFHQGQQLAKKMIESNDPIYRAAAQTGLFGGNSVLADITDAARRVQEGVPNKNILQMANDFAVKSYSQTDDVAKLAALNTWLKKGVAWDEAINRVSRSFQNYKTVGFLYDLGSKLPIIGNPFVKFQGDILRMVKNSAVDNPFGLAGMIATWKLITDSASVMSGEDFEDQKTRESRLGAPRIPFTNISLLMQTPAGELNMARLLGLQVNERKQEENPFGSKTLGDIAQYAPIDPSINDPFLGPPTSVLVDQDFRGKKITDPSLRAKDSIETSGLTPEEMTANKGKYLARSYAPPLANSISDFGASLQGKPDFYGNEKTPVQAGLRVFPGVKVEQFGADKAQENRDAAQKAGVYQSQDKEKGMAKNAELLAAGKIDQATFDKRTASLSEAAIKPFLGTSTAKASTSKVTETTAAGDTSVADDDTFKLVVKAKMKQDIVPSANDLNRYYFSDQDFKSEDADTANKAYAALLSKMNSKDVPDAVKPKLVEAAGVDPKNFEYYTQAAASKTAKIKFITDKLSSKPEDALNYLLAGKRTINGKAITTTELTDYLYDQNLISKEDKALVNALKYDENAKKYYFDRDYNESSGSGSGGLTKSKIQTLLNKIDSEVYQMWKDNQPKEEKQRTTQLAKAVKTQSTKPTGNNRPLPLVTGRSFQVKRKQTVK